MQNQDSLHVDDVTRIVTCAR